MALVSVIMTFYNESESQLKRSIFSILNQTLTDFEYIIVSGNPENIKSNTFVKEIKDQRIKYVALAQKTRMSNCLNLAINNANSDYIAIQEADDESLPERLKIQFEFLKKNPNVDIVGTAITYIDDYTKKNLAIRFYPENPTKTFNRYAAIAHPTIFAKRELYQNYGTYLENDEYKNCPDYELWLRWLTKGVVFRNINIPLFNYYQSKENGRNKNVKKTLSSVIKLKSIYKSKLAFSLIDEVHLFLERCICLLPKTWISNLFYIWVKL